MPVAPKYGNREQRIQYRRNLVLRYTIAGFQLDQIRTLYNREIETVDPTLMVGIDTLRDDRRAVLKGMGEEFLVNQQSYRALLIERAELGLRTLYPMVQAGNLGAIDRWLRTLSFIADVSGSNAPIQLEVEDTTRLSPEERATRMMQLLELARTRASQAEADEDILDVTPIERLALMESTDGIDSDR